MNKMPLLFLGLLFTFALSWAGMVAIPYYQVGRMRPVLDDTTALPSPPALSGLALRGRAVYAANGCANCHTQQVRQASAGADIARGWGVRGTVSRDYIEETPSFLGTVRSGPDLSNIAPRWGKDAAAVNKHHAHLYSPVSVTPGSTMAPFPFLYSLRKVQGQPSSEAIAFSDSKIVPAGYEVVPSHDAKALVAYLLSLDRSYELPEAPTE